MTMKVAVFSSKRYDIDSFNDTNPADSDVQFDFFDVPLNVTTAPLAAGHEAVCVFVNDQLDKETLEAIHKQGVRFIALRCAGFNNVDLVKARELNIQVVRVPAYSPEAVAEFAVGMIMTVVRKYHKAFNRVREGNFLLDGLLGFNLHGKTVGLIGTGKIGMLTGNILSKGFGCRVIAYDVYPNEKAAAEHGISYVKNLDELLGQSDIVSLHCPLMESTFHLLNEDTLFKMKKGAVLINTSRGGLIDANALIKVLKAGHLGAVGMDVYEAESAYFFADSSEKIIQDDVLARLLSFYNVFVSGHQAFLTKEALAGIAGTTISNLKSLAIDGRCENSVLDMPN